MQNSLAEKIAGVLTSAPSTFDQEDDDADATTATVSLEVEDAVEDTKEEEQILSKFRTANVDLLADVDSKYAGKKTSRRNLKDGSTDEDGSDASEVDSDADNALDSTRETYSDEEDNFGEEEEHQDDSEDESSESFTNDIMVEDNIDINFKHLNESNESAQQKKATCVRNQMAMWESLLEMRIQLQKCLIAANKMPQIDTYNELKQHSELEFTKNVTETKETVMNTLSKLLQLQQLLLKQYPETKNIESKRVSKVDSEDEEIASDSEPEDVEKEEKETEPKKKKQKLGEYEQEINNQHQKYKNYRNSVIQKWNDKTRVIVKSSTPSYSVLNQIEYNLSNMDKLIKKTQLKRSQYHIVGEKEVEEGNKEESSTEIYDDDDFYHQLLRELIEVKSADITDPIQLGRQWIQLQHLRSKMKRKVDTRATKGRKIRYTVHTKLVNYMAPIENNLLTEEAKNELYSSLFGKNQSLFKT